MKKLLLLLLFTGSVMTLVAQEVEWFREHDRFDREKGFRFFRGYAYISEIHAGANGGVITGGQFTDIMFGDSLYQSVETSNSTSYRYENIYLASYGADGTEEWIRTFLSASEVELVSMETDAQGNSYFFLKGDEAVTSGSVVFLQDGAGNEGGYQLIKLDASGNLVWTSNLLIISPEAENDNRDRVSPVDIAVSQTGEVYAAMTFSFDVKLAPGYDFEASDRDDDPLLVKYNSEGQLAWAKQGYSDWQEDDQSLFVSLDTDGNLLLGGTFFAEDDDSRGLTFVQFGTRLSSDQADEGVFMSKFSPEGANLWLRSFTDDATFNIDLEREILQDMAIDGTDIVLSILFDDDLIVGTDTLINTQAGSDKTTALIKLDTNGDPIWTRAVTGIDFDSYIEVDPINEQYLLVSDYNNREVIFKNTGVSVSEDLYGGDYFMALYDRNGGFVSVDTTEHIYNGGESVFLNNMPMTYLSDGTLAVGMHFGGPGSFSSDDIPYGQMTLGNVTIDTAWTVLAKLDFNKVPMLPVVDLGEDVVQCEGEVILDAGIATQYLWSTGATGQTITVDSSGTFAVRITDDLGQTATDTISVTIGLPLSFNFPDSLFGLNRVDITSPVNAESYLWSTGETSESIRVNTEGYYSLKLFTEYGCESEDSVYVQISQLPIFDGGPGSGDAFAQLSNGISFYDGGTGSGGTFAGIANDTGFYHGGTGSGNSLTELTSTTAFYFGGISDGYAQAGISDIKDFYDGGAGSGYQSMDMLQNIAFYEGGNGAGYSMAELIEEIITSIDNGQLAGELSVFPNPAKDFITLSHPADQIYAVKLYDLSGSMVAEVDFGKTGQEEVKIAVSSLPAGTYLIVVQTGDVKPVYHKMIRN